MADQEQPGTVRHPQPDAAAQDPNDAEVQRRVHADSERNREQADRVRASTPPEVRDKPVDQIVDEAAQRAERDARDTRQ
jgi:hypothetical protein